MTEHFTAASETLTPLLEVRNLCTHFRVHSWRGTELHQVLHDVSFSLHHKHTLGLVGESGCGKTTLARTLLLLQEPSSGSILYRGQDIVRLPSSRRKSLRREVQMVFQDPHSSLNPRRTIGKILLEPLEIHRIGSRRDRHRRVTQMLERVGLTAEAANCWPHEFSGGERQRIGIARALITRPSILICDEATSALDVSIQAQILELLKRLQHELGLSYLFISHDLAVVAQICDEIAVMHRGRLIERQTVTRLLCRPRQAYTQSLVNAVPRPDPRRRKSRSLT